jgi:hypothetical protein
MSADETNPNPDDTGTGDDQGADSGSILGGDDTTGQIDYEALFTPEEVEAKKTAIEAAKAEEDRREKLTDEERAAEDAKKAEDEKKNSGAPEKYEEFKIPKDTKLDAEMFDKFTPLAKELNLSQEKAQELVDFYAATVIPEITRQQTEMWETTKTEWGKTAIADKVFGGDKQPT